MTARAHTTLRRATPSQAARLYALISANREEGRLLPREPEELEVHANRFVIAIRSRTIVGCAELAPLSSHVAEVRSLAVDPGSRGLGVGTKMVEELRLRARQEGYDKLCAFTHRPGYFITMGFSIVPHAWLLEKIHTDCLNCPLFRRCGQYAMEVPLDSPFESIDRDTTTVASRHA